MTIDEPIDSPVRMWQNRAIICHVSDITEILTRAPAGGLGRMPRLVITDDAGRRVVEVATPRFKIGRSKHADLYLSDADVSREHWE